MNCIIVLRPTRSRSLYQQMVGRGMRLDGKRKKTLLLLDFLWHTEEFDICKPSSLICKSKEIANEMDQMLEEDGELDIVEAEERIEQKIIADREAALAKELAEMRMKRGQTVDAVWFSLAIRAESLVNYVPCFKWESDPPTERQLERLAKDNIEVSTIQSKGHASAIIKMLNYRIRAGLTTPKQIIILERKGFRKVGLWTKEEASQIIGILINNGWRVPHDLDPDTYLPVRVMEMERGEHSRLLSDENGDDYG